MTYFNQRQWLPLLATCVLLYMLVLAACGGAQTAETPVEPVANEALVVAEESAAVEEPADSPTPPMEEPADAGTDLDRGRIEVVTIPSPSLADAVVFPVESNDVFVYLPPGYDTSDKSYPVIYTMPGMGFLDYWPKINPGPTAHMLDGLWKDGTLPPMMFVFCVGGDPGGGPGGDGIFFAVNSSFEGDVPRFCAKDVVETIDANYRTQATPGARGLLGDSVTGDGTLRMAAAYPDVFSTVYINHPWLLAEGALADAYFTEPSVVEAMLAFADTLRDIPPDEADTVFLEIDDQINFLEARITLLYAMQYLAEPEPPYFSYLYTDVDTPADPEVWNRWEAGVGTLEERVTQMKEGLTQLTGLGIGSGSLDHYAQWAVPGADELHRALMESGVPHQFDEYAGGSRELRHRLGPVIMPFFAEHLETEPSS